GSDVVSALTVLAVPVLHATVGIAFWQLLVLVALNGAARAPAPAASLVLLIALSDAAGSSGDRERALYTAGIRLAAVLGAPVGGALIAWRGASAALVADAATFAVSALVLVAAVRLPRATTSRAAGAVRPWAGLSVLAGDRLLRAMSALVVVLALLSGAWSGVLAPAYGLRVLHSPAALGLLLGVFGAGALLGSLAGPWLAARSDHHRLVWTCLALGTVPGYGVPALTTAVPVLAAAMVLSGVGTGVLGPLWLGLLSTRTQAHQHGHVFGVTSALEQAGVAVGALTGGLLLDSLGMTATLAGAAAVGAGLAASAALTPALGDLHAAGRHA
ncbi:MAG TPA: MFS transporter, partial [Geodermatophilus sp.]|nr:MFS transporter [Geodermatophilus sp.]